LALLPAGALGDPPAGAGAAPKAERKAVDRPSVPTVRVSRPLVREVRDYADFIGRLEPHSMVEVRARVRGMIEKVAFQPGTKVAKGDLLFELDPRPYQAELAQAEAKVRGAEARLKGRSADLRQARALQAKNAISQGEFDKIEGESEEAEADLKAAQAARDLARLNLEFTKVRSPIDGKVGLPLVTVGNVPAVDTATLVSIVSLDPMYVHFDLDERTLLLLNRAGHGDAARPAFGRGIPVAVALAGEDGFPRRGQVDGVGNQVNPQTGAVQARAILPNADGALLPGMSARVRLPMSEPHKVLLVPGRAIEGELTLGSLLVVNDRNVVEHRNVRLGLAFDDLWVVKEGLSEREWVVPDRVGWLGPERISLEPGMAVKPERVEMPTGPAPGNRAPADRRQPQTE
jgi:RND family efflux transporter MFP subunit